MMGQNCRRFLRPSKKRWWFHLYGGFFHPFSFFSSSPRYCRLLFFRRQTRLTMTQLERLKVEEKVFEIDRVIHGTASLIQPPFVFLFYNMKKWLAMKALFISTVKHMKLVLPERCHK